MMAHPRHGRWTGPFRGVALASLWLIPLGLDAEVRASANYSVEAESVDGGGGWSTSASYANQGSLEALVTGKSSTTNYEILHGFITGLTVADLSGYDTWAEARGLTPGVNAGYLDDPNQDGRPNIQHFAFGSDPIGSGSVDDKRQITVTDVGGENYLTLTLPVRSGAVFSGNPLTSNLVDGVSYVILGDGDLVDPWELTVVELVPALADGFPSLGDDDAISGPDWQYRSFRLTDSVSTSPHAFIKAGVTPAP